MSNVLILGILEDYGVDCRLMKKKEFDFFFEHYDSENKSMSDRAWRYHESSLEIEAEEGQLNVSELSDRGIDFDRIFCMPLF